MALDKESLEFTIGKLRTTLIAKKASFLSNVASFVSIREAGGMSQQAITDALRKDFDEDGPIFGSLKSMVTQSFSGFLEDVADETKDSIFQEEYGALEQLPYMWVATLVNTCPDCLDLHGEVKSLAEWEEEGVPNIRPTVCTLRSVCRCELVPMDSMGEEDKNSVIEPIKLQRERIAEYARARREDGISLSKDYKNTLLGQANNPKSVIK